MKWERGIWGGGGGRRGGGADKKTHLDPINRVDVPHAVDDDSTDLLERLERTHGGDCVSLNEDVAVCEEFDSLFPDPGLGCQPRGSVGLEEDKGGGGRRGKEEERRDGAGGGWARKKEEKEGERDIVP